MRPLPTHQPLDHYRHDPDLTEEEQLASLLESYGFEGDLPLDDDGELVDLRALIDNLPEKLEIGINAAREELTSYYSALPPKRRARGIYVRPSHLISLLLERLEFFEGLQRGLVRQCRGQECPHYSVCPFKEIVRDVTEHDEMPCAVEREVVKDSVKNFVRSPDNAQAPVDPRHPQAALLFKMLVQYLVKQARISMYMQMEDMLIDNWEILREGDVDKFDAMNQIEHPLVEAWDRNTQQIQRIMKDMGITPEFQIRQGIAVDESQQIDAKKRSVELALNYMRDASRSVAQKLPKDSPERDLMMKALEAAEQRALEEQESFE